jgi:hypothetical protein
MNSQAAGLGWGPRTVGAFGGGTGTADRHVGPTPHPVGRVTSHGAPPRLPDGLTGRWAYVRMPFTTSPWMSVRR